MIEPKIGTRLKALREARGLSQDALREVFGFKDRQTVSHIESGSRRLSAEELVKALAFFDVTLDHFTNPFLLPANAKFSWRQHSVAAAELERFQQRAGEWIGAYRELHFRSGKPLRALMPRLGLTHTSSFEEARVVGESVSGELDLGEVPGAKLAEVMEGRLGILVLMVDAIRGVSGAACTLPELNAVLINRHEPEGRRNFDLAHELFHLLTWQTMPPQWIDGESDVAAGSNAQRKRVARIEQLANSFASGLLMPTSALDRLGQPHGDLVEWINAAAGQLRVSSSALKWCLVNSGRGPQHIASIPDDAFNKDGRGRLQETPTPLFSRTFIQTIALAIERGHLSSRRAAALTDLSVDALGELCDIYGIERPAEL